MFLLSLSLSFSLWWKSFVIFLSDTMGKTVLARLLLDTRTKELYIPDGGISLWFVTAGIAEGEFAKISIFGTSEYRGFESRFFFGISMSAEKRINYHKAIPSLSLSFSGWDSNS